MQPFSKKPRSDEERGKLEQAIIAAFEKIDFVKLDVDITDTEEYWELGDRWKELRNYYQHHDDPVIGVRLIDELMQTTEVLVHLASAADVTPDKRRIMFEALHSLWTWWMFVAEAAIDWENE